MTIDIKLRMEMGNMPKIQQPDQRADKSRRPQIGLKRIEKSRTRWWTP